MQRLLRTSTAALALALLAALAVYAWRGTYTRYLTDDYCSAARLRNTGFAAAMRWHWTEWSGRYSYYAIKAIPESIGTATAPVMPALMIALFCACAVWSMRRVTRDSDDADRRRPRRLTGGRLARQDVHAGRVHDSRRDGGGPLLAWLCGLAIVFATIDATPDILSPFGPLLWETGVLTYMLPLLFYTLWLGMFFAPRSLAARCILSAFVMLIAGGLSETSLAAQGGLAAGILFVAIVKRMPDATKIAASGLAASLAAGLIAASAPGNLKRMAGLDPRPLLDAITDVFRLGFFYIGSNAFVEGASFIILIACGFALGTTRSRAELATILLLALAACGAFLVSILPSTWMLSGSPPPRALHVSTFFFAAMTFALATALGIAFPRFARIAAPVLVVVSIGIAAMSMARVWRSMEDGQRFAAEADRIAGILRANPGKDLTIQAPYGLAERMVFPDRDYWTNTCISDYYHVRSLTVTRWAATR